MTTDDMWSMGLTTLWASVFIGGAICDSDRVQLAALAAVCWNVGWDLGVVLRERRQRLAGVRAR